MIAKITSFSRTKQRAPAKIEPAIAAAQGADSVLDTVVSLVVDKQAVRAQLEKIEKVKRLPPLVKPYPYCLKLYLQLEKLIVETEPPITDERYNQNSLREIVRNKADVLKLKKPLLYIFLDEDELNLSFLYDLINAFTIEVSSSLRKDSIRKLDRIYRAIPLFEGVRFSSVGLSPFETIGNRLKNAKVGKGIRVSYAISPIFTSASRFLASIYFEAVDSLGEKQASELLKKAYQATQGNYGFLPSSPNVAKYLPPGVFEATGEQRVAAAAAAAAAAALSEKLLNFVTGIIEAKEQVRPILDRLELHKKKPFWEREDAYLVSYLELETFIVSHSFPVVKKDYTVEALRQEIRNRFNVRRLKPKFGSLFRIPGVEKLIYYELLIETFIMQILHLVDVPGIVKNTTKEKLTAGIAIKGGKPDFSVPELKIFNLPRQWHKLISANFNDLFSELYAETEKKMGEERARRIVEDTYRKLQDSYGMLPLFSESLSVFLKGILEEVVLLRRDELEERIRERTEELEVAKAYTENIVKSMIDTLLVVDPEGKIKTINPASVELLGYKEEELIGKPVATIFAEEEEEEEEESIFKGTRLQKLMEEGSIRDYDMTYRTKSGEKIPVSFSGSVMRETRSTADIDTDKRGPAFAKAPARQDASRFTNDASRKIIGIVGIARDMREMKRLMEKEKELAAAAAAAAAAEKKRAGELEAAFKELRRTQEQLIQAGKMAGVGQLAGGVAHELNNPLVGTLNFAQLLLRKMKEDDPHYRYAKIIETGASECKRIVSGLLSFSRQAKEPFVSIDVHKVIEDALSLIGHQLKIQNIKIVRDFAPQLPKVTGSANQIQQVVMNLLSNARDAIGTRSAERGTRSVSIAERGARNVSNSERGTRNAEEGTEQFIGQITISTTLIDADTDTDEHGKVSVGQRLPRANEVSLRGQYQRLPAEARSAKEGKSVCVSFADTGEGISRENLDKVFDPFFTTKEPGVGVGLGLSISYGIIKDHNGDITAESGGEGKGARFTVVLPVGNTTRSTADNDTEHH